MLSNILRLLAKLLLGFTVCVIIIWSVLMFAIHLPDSQNKELFRDKRASFEDVNYVLRSVLKERGRTKMVFEPDFEAGRIRFNRETVYDGEGLDGLESFGVLVLDDVTVREDMTVFSYSGGLEAVVYTTRGNPGSFSERFAEPMSRSYKLADNWYYTQCCDLDD